MENLPQCRVVETKAFLLTGYDYTGPLRYIPYRKRGVNSLKIYICLFVCLLTQAIDSETVYDLNTANFLQAFKRFLSYSGVGSELD